MTSTSQATPEETAERLTLDLAGVMEVLPHREPFLFLHQVTDLEPGVRARGSVEIPPDHPYVLGQAEVPSGIVIEAMAQLGGVAMLYSRRGQGALVLFRSIHGFRMTGSVPFGARLDLAGRVGRVRGRFGEVVTEAWSRGQRVAEATLGFAVME